MKKYEKQDQKLMATWAADCAERVLPFFEKAYPEDDRPRKAIEACRAWVRTGVFRMAEIRGASLAAHAAARKAKENEAACFAAHAAGQAVATAHVPQHAYGGAYYALKAIVANDPRNAEVKSARERNWQSRHLPENLREEIMKRIIIQKKGSRTIIKIQKGEGY
jgi:Imm-5 like putative immunity protein